MFYVSESLSSSFWPSENIPPHVLSSLHMNFQVASLFDDQPDLLDEFTRFLPDTSATTSTHQGQYGHNPYPRFNERTSATPTLRPMPIDKVITLNLILISVSVLLVILKGLVASFYSNVGGIKLLLMVIMILVLIVLS